MQCDEVLVRLWEYLDRELGPYDALEMNVHLTGCADCYPVYRWDVALLNLLARVRVSLPNPRSTSNTAGRRPPEGRL
jgi:hypothetical protein